MAEVEDVPEVAEGEEENYQPPPEKSIDALMEADQVSISRSICCSKQSLPPHTKAIIIYPGHFKERDRFELLCSG